MDNIKHIKYLERMLKRASELFNMTNKLSHLQILDAQIQMFRSMILALQKDAKLRILVSNIDNEIGKDYKKELRADFPLHEEYGLVPFTINMDMHQ